MAVRLIASIRAQFGHSIPLSALFEASTVEHLAAYLRDAPSAPPVSRLLALSAPSEGAPFFCIHPVGGTALCYLQLARGLGRNHSLYGVQAQGLEPGEPLLESIEQLAACYLADIKKVQPSGPYRLGGWSLGGLVALELARQLRTQGEQVSIVVLMDTRPPAHAPPVETDEEVFVLAGFAADLAQSVGRPSPVTPEALLSLPATERMNWVLNALAAADLVPHGASASSLQQHFEMVKRNLRAARAHIPGAYDGRVCVVRATRSGGDAAEPLLGWDAHVSGPLEQVDVDADHYSLLGEHVASLAEALRRVLEERVQQDLSPPHARTGS